MESNGGNEMGIMRPPQKQPNKMVAPKKKKKPKSLR